MPDFIEINILRPYGPNSVNRDGNGNDKTLTVGDVLRARNSSAAIKYVLRLLFAQHEAKTYHTRHVPEALLKVAEAVEKSGDDLDEASLTAIVNELMKISGNSGGGSEADQSTYEKLIRFGKKKDKKSNDDEDEEKTLLDVIESRSEKAPDWAITYLSEMAVTKEKVRKRHFDEAATIFEEAMEMKEKGLTLYDVARKHRISEERVRQLLHMIKEELNDDISPSSSYRTAA